MYLEKPLARDLVEGEEIVAAWRRSGKVGAIGFNFRFHPLVRAARRELERGRIGSPHTARTTFCAAPRSVPAWKTARATGGGALLDLASHHVDLVPDLLGSYVEEVFATIRSSRNEQDTVTLELRLRGGALVQTFVSTRRSRKTGSRSTATPESSLGSVPARRRRVLPPKRESSRRGSGRRCPQARGGDSATSAGHVDSAGEPSFELALRSFVPARARSARRGRPRRRLPEPGRGRRRRTLCGDGRPVATSAGPTTRRRPVPPSNGDERSRRR